MSHTPGPWTAEGSIIGADRTVVAYRVNRPAGGNQRVEDANARLIAAAPDLLEACKLAKDRITELANDADCCWLDWPGAYEIDAAIARAEGRTDAAHAE